MIPAELLKNRLISLLVSRKGEFAPANPELDKFDHSLQCATRALRAGEPHDYVVMALFHDVFGGFSANDHGAMCTVALMPYIRESAAAAVMEHENAMEKIRAIKLISPDLAPAALPHQPSMYFAWRYDYPSFDPNYKSEVLAYFYPLIDEVIHD